MSVSLCILPPSFALSLLLSEHVQTSNLRPNGEHGGHIFARLQRQQSAPRQLVKITNPGPLDDPLHSVFAPVVGRERESPVTELPVKVAQVSGGGARRMLRMRA